MKHEKPQILLIEDEEHIAFALKINLETEGYEVTILDNGEDAMKADYSAYDCVLLDIMLPNFNGYEIATKIRSKQATLAIIMITAKTQSEDKIKGFERGIDDYVTKPFEMKELLLRIRRVIERSEYLKAIEEPTKSAYESRLQVQVGDKVIDFANLKIATKDGDIDLTELEAALLQEFVSNKDKVLSREYLLRKVWQSSGQIESRTVDNFVLRLRKHIEADPKNPQIICSVRGRGYRFSI